MLKLEFLGAAQTVTGSKYLIHAANKKVLVDCGIFQGLKELRQRNWDNFPVDPKTIDAVVLTHAHLDHSGYIPLLVKRGFRGPIYCTEATRDLCGLLLPDSGYLQEEEANYLNKNKRSRHKPALPLYDERDARISLNYFKGVDFRKKIAISNDINFEFFPAGHLLGAASIRVETLGRSIVFSGDIGRKSDPILKEPFSQLSADVLLMEATYGNRVHPKDDPKAVLKSVVLDCAAKRSTLLIPSFAVGRAQLVLYYLYQLKKNNEIPDLPIYLNSPMANQASEIFQRYSREMKLTAEEIRAVCDTAQPVMTVDESKALNMKKNEPMIIIAASGMATGGRVLHHLKEVVPNPDAAILFVGYQAAGTRGEALVSGVDRIKIHGEIWPVRAKVMNLDTLSAHADSEELCVWLGKFSKVPRRIFLVHGETDASSALKEKIRSEFKVEPTVPSLGESYDL